MTEEQIREIAREEAKKWMRENIEDYVSIEFESLTATACSIERVPEWARNAVRRGYDCGAIPRVGYEGCVELGDGECCIAVWLDRLGLFDNAVGEAGLCYGEGRECRETS